MCIGEQLPGALPVQGGTPAGEHGAVGALRQGQKGAGADPLRVIKGHLEVAGGRVEAGQRRGEHPEVEGGGSHRGDGVAPC